jgi:hypothetical protein
LLKATDRAATVEVLLETVEGTLVMQTRSKADETDRGQWVYPENEAAYWRERHSKQPYAKNSSYDQYEHAYRTGYTSFQKFRGKKFDEVEESVANDYETGKPDSALPWDTVRPAVSSVWDKMSGVVGPRDFDRGIRDSI